MSLTSQLLYQNFREVKRAPSQRLLEIPPPPFRTYSEFMSRTLNPQHYSGVELDWETAYLSHTKWFTYQCVRHSNQFTGKIDFIGPNTYLSQGIKGGGKSALNGNIAARFPKVVVVHMARDDEGLKDLQMFDYRNDPEVPRPIQENVGQLERGLIVGPPGVDVKSSYDYITYDKLTLNDIENHDVVVAPQRIHKNRKSFFQCGEFVVDLVSGRVPSTDRGEVFLKVLEAANIIYARIALKGAKVDQAKAHLVYLMREMRHCGVAMGLDTQYATSMDREVRTNADYIMTKNMGSDRLPDDTDWQYGYFTPIGLMSLYQNEFVCKDKWGGLYTGMFKLPPWHKTPKENVYKSMDIVPTFKTAEEAEYEAKPLEFEDVVTHNEIIQVYEKVGTFKGTERQLRLDGTAHDLKTIKNHAIAHFQAKSCSCWKQNPSV